jgi:hypothetical protein
VNSQRLLGPPNQHGGRRVDLADASLSAWNGTTWTQLNAAHPASMAVTSSTLYVDFAAYGLYTWNGKTWTQINAAHPASMVAGF